MKKNTPETINPNHIEPKWASIHEGVFSLVSGFIDRGWPVVTFDHKTKGARKDPVGADQYTRAINTRRTVYHKVVRLPKNSKKASESIKNSVLLRHQKIIEAANKIKDKTPLRSLVRVLWEQSLRVKKRKDQYPLSAQTIRKILKKALII